MQSEGAPRVEVPLSAEEFLAELNHYFRVELGGYLESLSEALDRLPDPIAVQQAGELIDGFRQRFIDHLSGMPADERFKDVMARTASDWLETPGTQKSKFLHNIISPLSNVVYRVEQLPAAVLNHDDQRVAFLRADYQRNYQQILATLDAGPEGVEPFQETTA